MSSPDAKPAAAKKIGSAKGAGATKSGEPSKSEKAAFLKAMAEGIKPGSKAAVKSAAKKIAPGAKAAAAKKPEKAAAGTPKVEVLRKISGSLATSTPLTPESERAVALAKDIEAALAEGQFDRIQPQAVQALMGALCKVYAANDEEGNRYPLLAGRMAVTGTDVMIVCGALLRAVDLQVFELGMWQSWSGR